MSENETQAAESMPAASPSAEERQWAMFAHLSALVGFLIPFGSLLGPLIIWQIKKAEMPFVDDQGKESLNFQITVFIAVIAAIILMFITLGLLFFVPMAVGIAALVLTIMAGIKANNGETYRYPWTLRLIK